MAAGLRIYIPSPLIPGVYDKRDTLQTPRTLNSIAFSDNENSHTPRNIEKDIVIFVETFHERNQEIIDSDARTGHSAASRWWNSGRIYQISTQKRLRETHATASICFFAVWNVRVEKTALFPHTCFRLPVSTGGCKHEPYCPVSAPRLALSCIIFHPRQV